MHIDHVAVESSNIKSIGYSEADSILEIAFSDGNIYQYYDVPKYQYDALMAPGSKGAYAHQNIYNNYKSAIKEKQN